VRAQAFVGLVFLVGVLAAALFVPPWTLDFWQAWAFLGVFGGACLAITIWLARRDPALLARRVKAGPLAEPTRTQQVVQAIASLAFAGAFVLAGLDRRGAWSDVPVVLVIAGDVLVAAGLAIVARVFRANTFTSAVIEVERAQQVVTTGPYAIVRHPMYAGAFVMLAGVPLALGSWIAFAAVAILMAVIVWRLLDEERLLVRDLAGYAAYRTTVRWRLIPRIW
jgi:protein-S-isoprenylcysteine O-methyltransferase Ste14